MDGMRCFTISAPNSFACKQLTLQCAGRTAVLNTLGYSFQLQVTQMGSTTQYWLQNSPHEKGVRQSSYKPSLLEEG